MYVQNGVQKIEVIVRRDGQNSTAQSMGGGASPQNITQQGRKISNRRLKRIILTNTTHAIAVGRQIANMQWNYFTSTIGIKHGDQSLQDNVHRHLEIMGDNLNVASSVIMGGIYGAWGGPVGAVVGSTLGAVSSLMSINFKYKRRELDFNVKVFKENNAIEYKRARANINLTTGRLR